MASVTDELHLPNIGSIDIAASGPLGIGVAATQRQSLSLRAELARCDHEIAAARGALFTGSIPIADALLWYCDWCRERELLESAEIHAELPEASIH